MKKPKKNEMAGDAEAPAKQAAKRKERPVPASIFFDLKDQLSEAEGFIEFSQVLWSSGLIFERPRTLRRDLNHPGRLELVCVFVDSRALANWLEDPDALAYYQYQIKPIIRSRPMVIRYRDVILDVDKVRTCACENHGHLIVEGQAPLLEYKGFLTCGDCLWGVPAYKLPSDVDLIAWSLTYRDVYKIWMRESAHHGWAYNELTDYHSKLNSEGRKIARALSNHYKVKTYYHLFVDEPGGEPHCPNCGRMSREAPWERPDIPDRICRRCHITFFSE